MIRQEELYWLSVTQLGTVDRSRLTARIGTLSSRKTRQVSNGVALVLGTDILDAPQD